jgi:uncharacterized membrane protein YkvA (DUF1232 family)
MIRTPDDKFTRRRYNRAVEFVAPDYRASLRRFVDGYRGSREQAILRAGDVFDFFARLYVDDELPRDQRQLVGAALAYFVVPDDVLPEAELGPYGLLDDLYVASHVYRLLRNELAVALVERAWRSDDDIDDAMDLVYRECRAELGKQRKQVLKMAGLN